MIYDLQKGSLLKRASAFLLDAILLVILASGFAFALSAIFNYDSRHEAYEKGIAYYSKEYNVDFDSVLTQADYEALSEKERENYNAALAAMNSDSAMLGALNAIVYLIITIVSLSVFLAFMIIEFIFPIIFKNGQTPGKKIFGLGVMRTNGVRLGKVSLFIRTFFGKYVIETMIPVLVIIMIIFSAIGITGSTGLLGPVIVLILFIIQLVMLFTTKTRSLIHDKLSDCVVVDLASQLIFSDEQAMIDYKQSADSRDFRFNK